MTRDYFTHWASRWQSHYWVLAPELFPRDYINNIRGCLSKLEYGGKYINSIYPRVCYSGVIINNIVNNIVITDKVF